MNEDKLDLILQELRKLGVQQQQLGSELQKQSIQQQQLSAEQQKQTMQQQQLSAEQQKMNIRLDRHELLVTQLIGKVSEVHEDVHDLKKYTNRIENKLDDHISSSQSDIRFLNHRIADAELEIDKFKNR